MAGPVWVVFGSHTNRRLFVSNGRYSIPLQLHCSLFVCRSLLLASVVSTVSSPPAFSLAAILPAYANYSEIITRDFAFLKSSCRNIMT